MKHGTLAKALIPYLSLCIAAAVLYGMLMYSFVTSNQLATRVSDLASTTAMLSTKLAAAEDALTQKNVQLSDALYQTQQDTAAIQTRLGGFEQTVGAISGTLGNLEKLSKTDPDLLKKYSKVYFLNENYLPDSLTQIDQHYVYSDTRPEKILSPVWPKLGGLMTTASSSGISLYIKSAYRSFDEQKSLKSVYSVTYGAGTANAFSADQGYSEHQLGTTVDFMTSGLNGQFAGFENTTAYTWLQNNAYRFGFILSYPKDNGYYVYEPWHWRYVGIQLATYLHDHALHFYDLEQRSIDEYLLHFFD